MTTARAFHTATLLHDGSVLVAGGQKGWGLILDSSELFDPSTGQWTPTGDMNVARRGATATLLPNGKVLVAGGQSAYGQEFTSAELYDPPTRSWSPTAAMHVGRYQHEAQLLTDGRVVVFGGYQQNTTAETPTTEIYDPAAGTWTQVGDMNHRHADFFSALLPGGRIVAAGGCEYGYCPGFITPSTEIFDPATETWTLAADMPEPKALATMTALQDGRAVVAGGVAPPWSETAAVEVYDPATALWTFAAPIASPRERVTQALLPNGQILAVGGGGWSGKVTTSQVYDPATDTWRAAGAMHEGRSGTPGVTLSDGRVLVGGGETNTGVSSSAEIFQLVPPPPNDGFATAIAIGSIPFAHQLDLSAATTEPGEPMPCGGPGQTAWYAFTPGVEATYVMSLDPVGSAPFPPLFNVYTGNSLDALSRVGGSCGSEPSSFRFLAGTTYHIQIAGDSTGLIRFGLDVPTPPEPDLLAGTDSGTWDSDNVTNAAMLTFTGTVAPGSDVRLVRDGVLIGAGTADSTTGAWSIDDAPVADGSYDYTATIVDAAGYQSPPSSALQVLVDRTAPTTPPPPDLFSGSDSGASSTDDVTNSTTLTFNGEAEIGATVVLYRSGAAVGTITLSWGTGWWCSDPVPADGVYGYTMRETDRAGNPSPLSGELPVTVDTIAPPAPAPDLAAASDSGPSDSDNVTNRQTLSLTGTTERSSTVTLYRDTGAVGTADADADSGSWSIYNTVPGSGGSSYTYFYGMIATDRAGNTSASSPTLTVIVDTVSPDAPPAPDLASVSDTGLSSTDNVTSATTLTFNGTAEPGSTVTLARASLPIGSALAHSVSGAWAANDGAPGYGSHSYAAIATDLAGNVSVASAPLGVTVATVPSAPTAVAATAGDTRALVSFTPSPVSTVGWDLPVDHYTVTAFPGGQTAVGTASPLWVTSLTNGTACTFVVTATNLAGTGPGSPPSAAVVPDAAAEDGRPLPAPPAATGPRPVVPDVHLAGTPRRPPRP
jgi:hypothetical protein